MKRSADYRDDPFDDDASTYGGRSWHGARDDDNHRSNSGDPLSWSRRRDQDSAHRELGRSTPSSAGIVAAFERRDCARMVAWAAAHAPAVLSPEQTGPPPDLAALIARYEAEGRFAMSLARLQHMLHLLVLYEVAAGTGTRRSAAREYVLDAARLHDLDVADLVSALDAGDAVAPAVGGSLAAFLAVQHMRMLRRVFLRVLPIWTELAAPPDHIANAVHDDIVLRGLRPHVAALSAAVAAGSPASAPAFPVPFQQGQGAAPPLASAAKSESAQPLAKPAPAPAPQEERHPRQSPLTTPLGDAGGAVSVRPGGSSTLAIDGAGGGGAEGRSGESSSGGGSAALPGAPALQATAPAAPEAWQPTVAASLSLAARLAVPTAVVAATLPSVISGVGGGAHAPLSVVTSAWGGAAHSSMMAAFGVADGMTPSSATSVTTPAQSTANTPTPSAGSVRAHVTLSDANGTSEHFVKLGVMLRVCMAGSAPGPVEAFRADRDGRFSLAALAEERRTGTACGGGGGIADAPRPPGVLTRPEDDAKWRAAAAALSGDATGAAVSAPTRGASASSSASPQWFEVSADFLPSHVRDYTSCVEALLDRARRGGGRGEGSPAATWFCIAEEWRRGGPKTSLDGHGDLLFFGLTPEFLGALGASATAVARAIDTGALSPLAAPAAPPRSADEVAAQRIAELGIETYEPLSMTPAHAAVIGALTTIDGAVGSASVRLRSVFPALAIESKYLNYTSDAKNAGKRRTKQRGHLELQASQYGGVLARELSCDPLLSHLCAGRVVPFSAVNRRAPPGRPDSADDIALVAQDIASDELTATRYKWQQTPAVFPICAPLTAVTPMAVVPHAPAAATAVPPAQNGAPACSSGTVTVPVSGATQALARALIAAVGGDEDDEDGAIPAAVSNSATSAQPVFVGVTPDGLVYVDWKALYPGGRMPRQRKRARLTALLQAHHTQELSKLPRTSPPSVQSSDVTTPSPGVRGSTGLLRQPRPPPHHHQHSGFTQAPQHERWQQRRSSCDDSARPLQPHSREGGSDDAAGGISESVYSGGRGYEAHQNQRYGGSWSNSNLRNPRRQQDRFSRDGLFYEEQPAVLNGENFRQRVDASALRTAGMDALPEVWDEQRREPFSSSRPVDVQPRSRFSSSSAAWRK